MHEMSSRPLHWSAVVLQSRKARAQRSLRVFSRSPQFRHVQTRNGVARELPDLSLTPRGHPGNTAISL
jgi:hypothetical protein